LDEEKLYVQHILLLTKKIEALGYV